MPRKARFGRTPQRVASKRINTLSNPLRRWFESLETRVMLSANDLLIGLYDGGGTLRYNESAPAPAPGAVAPGDNGLDTVSGEAVAPDGTFYVSSLDTGQVFHYSNAGVFLGTLGENDATQAPLEEPGTLAFGPNGNLYVADLATSAIYQFNVNSPTQQYQQDDTVALTPDDVEPGEVPVPGGFTFAANGDLIVGDLGDGSVATYENGSRTGYIINPFTTVGTNDSDDTNDPFLNPAAILAENNGNLLIADIDFDGSNEHHQVVQYNATTQTTSQFINLTTPLGTNSPSDMALGNYAQPESLLLDQDGNLLVGVSPDHNGNGAVQKYDINTGAYISTIVSGIATPAALAYIPAESSNLLVTDYDNSSVLRYDDSTDAAVPGGVASGSNGGALNTPAGIAVAPDGTYYVSSIGTGQVLHYSSSGTLLGALGANDTTQAPLEEPGVLAFGPNGNLYVADLATSAIYQFNVNSPTQQYQADDTIVLTPDDVEPGEVPVPGGFTFAANGDLIVGDIGDGSVATYHDGSRTGYIINPFTTVDTNDSDDTNDPFLNPSSILALSNGNLLIADIDFDGSNEHHQVVQYNASNQTTTQFINLTTPLGTNSPTDMALGNYAQPESLLLDQDGNLLVGVSPDHNDNGAVQKYDVNSGAYISTIVSGIGTPSGLALTRTAPVVTTSGGATLDTAGQTVTVDGGVTLSDVDTLPDLSATVTISSGQAGDTLHFTNTANITGTVTTPGGVYTLTLTGNATADQYQAALQSITFSSTSTSTADRTISFTAYDGISNSVTATKQITVSAPVAISQLYVNGSTWAAFDTYLGAHDYTTGTNVYGFTTAQNIPYGNSTLGFALLTGANQVKTLPWSTINEVDIQFSGALGATPAASSFKITGGTGGAGHAAAAPSVTSVTSLGGNAYQLTLSSALGYNNYIISIASTGTAFGAAVTDANGAGISGSWTNSSSTFPSGNGLAGSQFNFQIDVLPGDTNQNGQVAANDSAKIAGLLNDKTTGATSASYIPFVDVNANGTIASNDGAVVAANINFKTSNITNPTNPSGGLVGSSGFTALALGVQESGSSTLLTTGQTSSSASLTAGSSPTTSVSNVSSPGSISLATGSVSPAATTSSSTGSGGSSGASTSTTSSHGRHAFSATDAAVSDFDLADIYA